MTSTLIDEVKIERAMSRAIRRHDVNHAAPPKRPGSGVRVWCESRRIEFFSGSTARGVIWITNVSVRRIANATENAQASPCIALHQEYLFRMFYRFRTARALSR